MENFKTALLHHRKEKPVYWKDSRELHRVMQGFPSIFRAILLELLDRPMSRHEIRDFLNRMARGRHARGIGAIQLDLEKHLLKAVDWKVLEDINGRYHLTPGGREIAEHMQKIIPAFIKWILSPETSSFLSLMVHMVLSILKLSVGFLSRSAGLTADGIDNAVDTLSSFLIWLGIKFDKEKLASVFILITMFLSVGGVALTTLDKVIHPGPIQEGLIAFLVSGLCGFIMLGLSAYQYLVGKTRGNFAIMCQAVDSRNHFWTSLLVCGGILLSFFAQIWNAPWLFYADAVASTLIGLMILRSAVELVRELFKKDGEGAEISHFMSRNEERTREKILLKWLAGQLQSSSLTGEELGKRFTVDFCEQTPKVLLLSGMGYRPESGADLQGYLDLFVKQKKLIRDDVSYWFVHSSRILAG
ncbi:MAG: cation transporter [Deltaproteobacteria bacterium]|nr:cation transporter [Deltaproteobacteria bacterium]